MPVWETGVHGQNSLEAKTSDSPFRTDAKVRFDLKFCADEYEYYVQLARQSREPSS